MRTLSHHEARACYDRIGARQDTQAFYEDRATERLLANGDFGSARSVFELGCGTGRFAEGLLRDHLPPDARYHGTDLSPEMVRLATTRLAPFGERATVVLSDGRPPADEPRGAHDRYVANFVLDLLAEDDIRAQLAAAHRMLAPGGLACLSSLSGGHGPLSRALIGGWSLLHRLSPALVGGCRPIRLDDFLSSGGWRIRSHDALDPFGLPLEAVVAERLPD